MGVEKLLSIIKEIDVLNSYFPSLKENHYSGGGFMLIIVFTLRPDVTKKLIEEVRSYRNIKPEVGEEMNFSVDPKIFKQN